MLFEVESHNFSQAETEITAWKAKEIHKITTIFPPIFTQNGPKLLFFSGPKNRVSRGLAVFININLFLYINDQSALYSAMLLFLHLISNKIFFHPAKFDILKGETISDYKMLEFFLKKYCNVRTKKLHKMKLNFVFFILGKKNLV